MTGLVRWFVVELASRRRGVEKNQKPNRFLLSLYTEGGLPAGAESRREIASAHALAA